MSRIRRRVENFYSRKADREWDMAGAARQDGDTTAEAEHTAKAREYEALAREYGSEDA